VHQVVINPPELERRRFSYENHKILGAPYCIFKFNIPAPLYFFLIGRSIIQINFMVQYVDYICKCKIAALVKLMLEKIGMP
jgi:hypothetical protein